MSAAASSLRAAIQEVVDTLVRRDFEELAVAYALVSLVPIDSSAAICAAWEWEYSMLCLELLPASLMLELNRHLPGLPWSLIVMPPSTEEVPPAAEELLLVEEVEEVVAPVTTRTVKGKGKAKAVEESRPEKVPRLRAKKSPQQIEVGLRNERPCDCCVAKGHSCYSRLDAMPATACYSCKLSQKGCSLSAGIVSNAEHLWVDAEHHSAPSGSIAHVRRTHVEIVDEGDDAPPLSPEVASRLPSGSPGSGLLALDPAVTATWSHSRWVVPAVDNAEAGPSKSTPVGEKRPRDEAEGMPPFKRMRFQVPEFGSQVFDANDPSQLLGVVALIPTQPPPPPSAPSASEDHSLQESLLYCSGAPARSFVPIHGLSDASPSGALLPGPPLLPLEDYLVYGHTSETEERSEAARDHEPTGEDGGEDFGKWCEEEEAEEEGWGLNDDECDSAESTDRGSYGEPEDAEWEDSGDECDCALVVDEDESDDSSSLVDLSEEEANALIAKYVPSPVVPSML
ncbi:hypothetical protein NEOLEDRAFT_1176056 [Neolentinus lepideus HHB14362 ss-1]|uniref:Uncharacterized protein n=1 Tax=Neolentinus lepideus HHB14362 ss-1 TaxID=1314782 RepID=A0A165UKU8_9AGAM|nr:hypothetical protein NEOLEDRAFT_1176056 [Neolentinus lepideus HHB14362 ss-1]